MLTLQVSVRQGSEIRSSRSVEQTRLSRFGFKTRVSAFAEKRRGPRVTDCRICLVTFERHGLREPRVLT